MLLLIIAVTQLCEYGSAAKVLAFIQNAWILDPSMFALD